MNQKKVDFLRVMIAAAWADGEVTCDELNTLKAYFRRMHLTNDEHAAIEPYLADPIDLDEARVIIEDFLAAANRQERSTLLAAARDLLLVDGEFGPGGEKEFLELLDESTTKTSTVGVFVGRLKRLWQSPPPTRSDSDNNAFRRSDLLDDFVRNRVLYQVKRRLLAAGAATQLDDVAEREVRYVCTIGALLGHVGITVGAWNEAVRQQLTEVLEDISSLQPGDIRVILEIVEEEVLHGVDYLLFAREFDRVASAEDRETIVDLLFVAANASGPPTELVINEIRSISNLLGIAHEDFIASKQRALGSSDSPTSQG